MRFPIPPSLEESSESVMHTSVHDVTVPQAGVPAHAAGMQQRVAGEAAYDPVEDQMKDAHELHEFIQEQSAEPISHRRKRASEPDMVVANTTGTSSTSTSTNESNGVRASAHMWIFFEQIAC